jgi:serine phosphatase RsbU (regulator of sigma subunit)
MSEKDDKVLYLTADCTGHGVPGAFMSMINTSLLNEVVNENGITQPNEIFYQVRKGIVKAMKQTGEMGEQKDGMDAVLCALLKENGSDKFTKLECAAANNSILIIRKGEKPLVNNGEPMAPILEEEEGVGKMYEIKSDRQPVGYKSEEMTPYTHHSIDLLPEDLIYTFSDGYQDQFGGPKGRKFMIKRQKKMLMEIYSLPLEKQKKFIIEKMDEWQTHPGQPDGYSEQIDDIIFIGVLV